MVKSAAKVGKQRKVLWKRSQLWKEEADKNLQAWWTCKLLGQIPDPQNQKLWGPNHLS